MLLPVILKEMAERAVQPVGEQSVTIFLLLQGKDLQYMWVTLLLREELVELVDSTVRRVAGYVWLMGEVEAAGDRGQ